MLGMPNDHTRAVPYLEAVKLSLSLGKQGACFRDSLVIGQTAELLDGLDPPPAHKIASHAGISTVDEGDRALFTRNAHLR